MQEMSFHSGLKTAAALSLAVGALFAGASGAASAAGLPDRGSDPIVLKGADAPSLIGLAPSDLVAFSYDNSVLSAIFFFCTAYIYGQIYRVMSLNAPNLPLGLARLL